MSEDWKFEDQAEKLTENPSAAIMEYISEHGIANWKDLIELLTEKFDLSEDEAEKLLKAYLKSGKLEYSKRKGGYHWSRQRHYPKPKFLGKKTPPRRKAKATIRNMSNLLHLPPDPHTVPVKSYFLARDNPGQPYYHPAMDQDKLAYLRAKKKMGAGADWPA